jgi:hypothetical protein
VSVKGGCKMKRIKWISLKPCLRLHKMLNLLSLYSFSRETQSLSMNMSFRLRPWLSTPLTTTATSHTTSRASRCPQEISFW